MSLRTVVWPVFAPSSRRTGIQDVPCRKLRSNINADSIMNVHAQNSRALAKDLVGCFMDGVYGESQGPFTSVDQDKVRACNGENITDCCCGASGVEVQRVQTGP